FTAIFSTISIVEERRSGFLQAALVAPLPRTALVLGTVLGGTTLAVIEAGLFLLLLPAVDLHPGLAGIGLILLIGALTALAFTALGFVIAWRMESTRGFHAVMNLFLLPLWFLSGAPFPLEGAAPALQWVMRLNPVTYAVDGIRQAAYLPANAPLGAAPVGVCLALTAVFAVALFALATWTVGRPLFERGRAV
ncbi:MAG TPA: ABC transporter permease, partial [Gemmatimonadaceae bacterium]